MALMFNSIGRGICWVLTATALTTLTGCASLRNGGAPDPAYTVQGDLESLKKQFEIGASVAEFYKAGNQTAERRNEFVSSRVAMANLAYLQFIGSLTADKQHLDAATDIFALGLNIGGTLVSSARAKANLAAVAALALGSKSSIDKHFYFEKTTPALIAAMNAQRKEVLVRILEGANLRLEQYSFTQGIADTHDYYAAGTLNSAISAIQADAGAKEAKADREVRMLKLEWVAPAEKATRASASETIVAIIASGNLDRVQKALVLLGLDGLPKSTLAEATESLEKNFRGALRANLGKAGAISEQLQKIQPAS
ncbi:MAG: hypothetical protein V4858_23860 [Pseudomonadota bacterium]